MAHEGQAVMQAAGILIPQSIIARSLDEAVRGAEKIGYPVVMKVVSRDILHKSDAGGVALDLEDKNEVIDAYQAILRQCRAYKADAHIEGVESLRDGGQGDGDDHRRPAGSDFRPHDHVWPGGNLRRGDEGCSLPGPAH